MKTKLTFFLFFAFFGIINAQAVTLSPANASENDSITITFDAKKAVNKSLVNYTGNLYVHTGVTTNKGNWQHVIAGWTESPAKAKLTSLGNDIYTLKIGKPREYYSVTDPSETILKLDFVFKSQDQSKQTEDIFADLYTSTIYFTVISPNPLPQYFNPNDTITVKIAASNAVKLSLYLDNVLQTSINNDTLTYSIVSGSAGSDIVKFIGQDAQGNVKADSFSYKINSPVVIENLPAGIKEGINYNSATSVTLVLLAPAKKFAYLTGDFNNWSIDPAYFMKRTPDGKRFWITLNNLSPGTEYGFQYNVEAIIKVADPYADKILDPWNDKYITADTYPGLKAYPVGKTDNIVSTFMTSQTPFTWTINKFNRPEKENLVIYELLVRDFVSTHSFKTLKDTLGYIKRLGFNAIELLPVIEFDGNESWGYNPAGFYFAPDKYYGTKDDLKRFIDECHKDSIAVIFDMVLNHSYGNSPMVRLYWDAQNSRPAANNPWFNQVSPNSTYSWGYDFNHESQATKDFIDKVNSYWITEYKVDGFRFDFTKGFTNKPGDGWAYDASRIAILKRMASAIWGVDSTAYVILEHLTDNSEETELANFGMMLWGNMNYSYNEATMGYVSTADLSGSFYKNRGWSKPNLVTYMESHDEERLMVKNIRYGKASGSYNIKDTALALNRIKLASAFFFTIPGPKMIWQFGELGYDYEINYNGRTGNKPIRWDYYNSPARKKLYKTMQAIINLKTKYNAFKTTNLYTSLTGAVKKLRFSTDSLNVSVIGNFDVVKADGSILFSGSGTYYNYFTGESIAVTNPEVPVSLEPGEFRIYTSKRLPLPDADILNEVAPENQDIVRDFELQQNYPNPFNPSTTINYRLSAPAEVSLKIFDMLGREVKTLINSAQQKGSFTIQWNGENNLGQEAVSGIYIYRLEAGPYSATKKMILLR